MRRRFALKKSKKTVRFSEKITDIYISFLVVAFTLFCYPNYSGVTRYKYIFVMTSALVFLLIFAVGNAEIKLTGGKSDFAEGLKRLKNAPTLFFLCYIFFVTLSFAFSPHRETSLVGGGKYDGFLTELLYFFLFAVTAAYGKMRRKYIYLLAFAVLANFALAVLQFFSLNPLTLYPSGMTYYDAFVKYSGEFLGTFGNVDVLSLFLSLAVPCLTVFAVSERKGKYALPAFLAAGLSVALLFMCRVKSGIVGVFCAAAVVPFMPEVNLGKRTKKIIFALYTAAFVIACFFAVRTVLKSDDVLMLGSGRVKIWRDSLRIFSEHPLLGSGPGTFVNEVSFSFERDAGGHHIVSTPDAAHNIFLQKLCTTGIFSLVSFVLFCVSVLKRGGKHSLFTVPCIISYLAAGFFLFEVCGASVFFYILCGLAVGDIQKDKEELK